MSYQELQPAQQAVQPGLQGTQLRLQGSQGRAPRSAQPLYMAQVGEQVGSQPCQHTWELGHRAWGASGNTCHLPSLAPNPPHTLHAQISPLPLSLSPSLTCRAPSAPALMAKVGRESRLWSPSAGNLSLCGGKEALRGTLPSSKGPSILQTGPKLLPPPRFCHRGSPEALPTPGPRPSPSPPVSPTSCAASCRVSARRERVRRTALSSSARGSGEARGGPGGGPGAAALSGHRLRATRTRQQTPGGGRKQGTQTGLVGLREEGLGVLSPRVERPGQVAGPGRASLSLSGSGCPARRSRRGPGRVDGPGVSRPPPDAGIWAPGRGMRGEAQARTCPLPGPREPESD